MNPRLALVATVFAALISSATPWQDADAASGLRAKIYLTQKGISRSLSESGVIRFAAANKATRLRESTDAPVEDISAIASYYASVSRRTADGDVFFADQSMTREEALRSYTIWAAYSAFEEHLKGSLEPGKLADITVLSQDILTIPEEELLSTQVDYTIVGGEVRYRR